MPRVETLTPTPTLKCSLEADFGARAAEEDDLAGAELSLRAESSLIAKDLALAAKHTDKNEYAERLY